MRLTLVAAVLAAGMVAAACGGDGGRDSTPTPMTFDSPVPLLTPEVETAAAANSAVPAVIRALQAHDVAALAQRVRAGAAPLVEACDGSLAPGAGAFAETARKALGSGASSAIYAVLKGSSYSARAELTTALSGGGVIIAAVPGDAPTSSLPGSLWYVDGDGNIAGMRMGCNEAQPLATVLAASFPKGEYLLKAN